MGRRFQMREKWFRVRDTYRVRLWPGQDASVLLAAVVTSESLTD